MSARGRFASPEPRRRRLGLTPLIDVIFLLVVFFLLASRFERDLALPIALAGGGDWEGPPRLVTLSAGGAAYNGVAGELAVVAEQAAAESGGARPVAVLPTADVDVQRIADALAALRDAGAGPAILAAPRAAEGAP